MVAIEMQGTTYPLRNVRHYARLAVLTCFAQFTSLLLFSLLLDVLKFLMTSLSFISFILTVALFLLKFPTFFSVLVTLRARGDDLNIALPFVGGRGGNSGGWGLPTSLPGSFPGQGNTAGNATSHHNQTSTPPPQFPSGGGFTLGTADVEDGVGHPTGGQPGQARGGYQTLG